MCTMFIVGFNEKFRIVGRSLDCLVVRGQTVSKSRVAILSSDTQIDPPADTNLDPLVMVTMLRPERRP
jgi:hypothetical protein